MPVTAVFKFSSSSSPSGLELDANFTKLVSFINALAAGTGSFSAIVLSPTVTASAPTPQQGMIYFNSTDSQFYGCKDGVTWSILG